MGIPKIWTGTSKIESPDFQFSKVSGTPAQIEDNVHVP